MISAQLSHSHVQLFAAAWTAARQASLYITSSCSLLKLISISQWCHPIGSSSVLPFSSCLQSFPALGSFLISQLFASDCQSIGALASASVLPMNIHDLFTLGLTGLIYLQSKGLSRVFFNTTVQKHQFFSAQLSLWSLHPYMTTGKNIALIRWIFVNKIMSLLLIMLSRFVITFLPRSKPLLISWLQSLSAVILEPPKIKSVMVSIASPFICHEMMGPDSMILVFWVLSFKPYGIISCILSKKSKNSSMFWKLDQSQGMGE